jgi:hypothetical protein
LFKLQRGVKANRRKTNGLKIRAACISFCSNVPELVRTLGLETKPDDWLLFIDSSKISLNSSGKEGGSLG